MSVAPLRRGLVLSRTSEQLGSWLPDHAQRSVGLEVGVSHTTIGRHGDDLHAWRVDEYLTLICAVQELRQGLILSLTADHAPGEALRAESCAQATVAQMGQTIASIMTRLSDGRITVIEARDTDAELCALEAQVALLRRDLQAKVDAGGP